MAVSFILYCHKGDQHFDQIRQLCYDQGMFVRIQNFVNTAKVVMPTRKYKNC